MFLFYNIEIGAAFDGYTPFFHGDLLLSLSSIGIWRLEEDEVKCRSLWTSFYLKGRMVTLGDPIAYRQSQPSAVLLGSEEGCP